MSLRLRRVRQAQGIHPLPTGHGRAERVQFPLQREYAVSRYLTAQCQVCIALFVQAQAHLLPRTRRKGAVGSIVHIAAVLAVNACPGGGAAHQQGGFLRQRLRRGRWLHSGNLLGGHFIPHQHPACIL